MKKILFILALFMGMLTANAQQIAGNFINEKGVRIINTKDILLPEGNMLIGINLSYHSAFDSVVNYYLTLTLSDFPPNASIEKDDKIQFETIDGKVEIGLVISSVNIEGTIATIYVVSPQTIENLSQCLTKMRIHYRKGGIDAYKDIYIDSGYIQHYIKKAYDNIQQTIPLPVEYDKSQF